MPDDSPRKPPPPRASPEEMEKMFRLGGPVQDSTVCLRLSGEDLDPEEITRVLGCSPTRAWRKGDVREDSKYHILERRGSWQLSPECDAATPLDEQVALLLARVSPDPAVWKELSGRFTVDVFCGVFLDEWNRGCGFGPDLLRRLADMGAELAMDIYGPAQVFPPELDCLLKRFPPGDEPPPSSG